MADEKISALGAAAALTGVEGFPVVQSGATVAATIDQVGVRLGATYVHAPTGTASTDMTVLNDAVSDTPANGLIVLANGGSTPYAMNAALVINKDLRIEGAGAVTPVTFANGESPLVSPFLEGPVLLQTVAATDGIQITNMNAVVHLKNIGIRFNTPGTIAFASTGHGINVTPAASSIGLSNATWENVWVFGHDGNHYAFYLVSPLLNQFVGLRSFGGGILYMTNQSGTAAGNNTFFNPFGSVFVAGSAHGYAMLTNDGELTNNSYYRPQVNANDYHTSTAYGDPAVPTSSQHLWDDTLGSGSVGAQNLYDTDFEIGSAMVDVVTGAGTLLWGSVNTGDQQNRVAFGPNAVAGTTGVAIGHLAQALDAQSTAIGNGATTATPGPCATAIGALAQATGRGSVAIGVDYDFNGAVASTNNYFVLGTSEHKYFMPGLPTSNPHVVGQLWSNSGVVSVSAG